MNGTEQKLLFLRNLTLFFGGFLLFTDVFFLVMGIAYEMPVIRYLIYVKLVINTTNIYLILKRHFLIATTIIYTVIMAMMIVGVICLGTEPAFQLYALGMMACISYNGYLHARILKRELPLALVIAIHVICYVGVYVYARTHEPLYTIPESGMNILILFNSVAAFSIVIIYVWFYHKIAIESEEKLENMALVDNLTGLYNRHYLLAVLDQSEQCEPDNRWLAMLDIDNFKKVNDTYGHNCGDYILHEVAAIARQTCANCTVCRWGGEEFIVLSRDGRCTTAVLETLRQRIADEPFRYDGKPLQITVTIGVMQYDERLTNDGWISKADEKLYHGKTHGKNQVVI